MELRRIDHNTYDLFQGNGWYNWTRIRKSKSNTYGILGQRIPHALMRDLNEALYPGLPLSHGATLEETIFNLNAISSRH